MIVEHYELSLVEIDDLTGSLQPAIDGGLIHACYNKLLKNKHKGNSWIDDSLTVTLKYLHSKLTEEFSEAQIAYYHNAKPDLIASELCDIINISAMLYRRYRRVINGS